MNEQDPNQPPVPPAYTPPPPPIEDASSQALSDALRSSFFIVKIIMVLLVLAFLGSGFFTVGPQEKAIVLRLGRPVGQGEQALLSPGFHWAFPKPIDEVERIPFTSLQTAESSVGWYLTPDERRHGEPTPPPRDRLDPATTSYAISADTNIIHVRADVHYRITDPVRFHFDFADASLFVTNALNNALLYATSQFPVDDILTKQRTAFREAVTARVHDLVDEEKLGITLEPLTVEVSPPIGLVAKFDEVDQATQKRDTVLSQAYSYTNNTLSSARAEAASRTYAAESARSGLVKMVGAQATNFTNLRPYFERDPAFVERILQMTALERIYTNAQDKILEPHLNSRELRLNLSREPQGPSTNSVAQ
jgi:membrane protease subunit HflK